MAPTRSRPLAVAQLSLSANLSHSYPPLFQIFHRLSHLLSLCNFLIRRYQSSISIVLHLRPLIPNHSLSSSTTSVLFSPLLQPHPTNSSLPATSTFISIILQTLSPRSFCLFSLLSISIVKYTFPTHDKNHILDLVITSSDTSLAPAVSFTHWSPYDHFPVFARLSINPAPLPPPTLDYLRPIDVGSFLTDLKSSQLITVPSKSLGPLLTLSSLLDKLAPIVTKLSRCQCPSNPWFSATLRAFRSTIRHAENIWKRTHSADDWSSFKSLCSQYHKLILSSKKRVLLQPCVFSLRQPQTSLANSQQTLHRKSSSPLPTTCPGTSLADSFASFLCFLFASSHRQNIQTPSFSHQQPCYIISALTFVRHLARFYLTRRVARSIGDSWASC